MSNSCPLGQALASPVKLRTLISFALLGLYAGELWRDEDIELEQARVPAGAGLLLLDKQV